MSSSRAPTSAKHYFEITDKDLPLGCPLEGTPVWNLHPRVYLPVKESKEVTCPYCGAHYVYRQK